jgi:hypothetical protein
VLSPLAHDAEYRLGFMTTDVWFAPMISDVENGLQAINFTNGAAVS